jgi:hypothetical protein
VARGPGRRPGRRQTPPEVPRIQRRSASCRRTARGLRRREWGPGASSRKTTGTAIRFTTAASGVETMCQRTRLPTGYNLGRHRMPMIFSRKFRQGRQQDQIIIDHRRHVMNKTLRHAAWGRSRRIGESNAEDDPRCVEVDRDDGGACVVNTSLGQGCPGLRRRCSQLYIVSQADNIVGGLGIMLKMGMLFFLPWTWRWRCQRAHVERAHVEQPEHVSLGLCRQSCKPE